MKKLLLIFHVIIVPSIIYGQQKVFTRNSNNSDLYINAIVADQDYYDKAILNYKILNHVINRFGTIDQILPKEKPWLTLKLKNDIENLKLVKDSAKAGLTTREFLIKHGVPTVKLFETDKKDLIRDGQIEKLRQLGVEKCHFQLPLQVKDLSSGFQFRHYVFDQNNSAAVQAFGINSALGEKAKYIIIDYLQYIDNTCAGLPKIRYAIGIRAEITFYNFSSKSNINMSSLPAIAADAQINNKHVNISIKTIGITGLGAKFNIPNNTSFNVDTYADYQKIIDFIRTFKEEESIGPEKSININGHLVQNDSTILFRPQLIPVMDEYRVTDVVTDRKSLDFIRSFERKLKKVNRSIKRYKTNKEFTAYYMQEKLFIEKQYREYIQNRETLSNVQHHNDTKQYSYILQALYPNVDSSTILNINKQIQEISKLEMIERQGYFYLLDKNIISAKKSFSELLLLSPTYKSVSELLNYLESFDINIPINDKQWEIIYKNVADKYLWKVSDDIKQALYDRIPKTEKIIKQPTTKKNNNSVKKKSQKPK